MNTSSFPPMFAVGKCQLCAVTVDFDVSTWSKLEHHYQFDGSQQQASKLSHFNPPPGLRPACQQVRESKFRVNGGCRGEGEVLARVVDVN
jgi:hypothetical protein